MIVTELFPFLSQVQPLGVAGTGLWATALYLGLNPISQWVSEQLLRWLNFAERSLYISAEEFEKTRTDREAQNVCWASILSIFPFLLVGAGLHIGIIFSLGRSWSISSGLIAVIIAGIYELGRRQGQSS